MVGIEKNNSMEKTREIRVDTEIYRIIKETY